MIDDPNSLPPLDASDTAPSTPTAPAADPTPPDLLSAGEPAPMEDQPDPNAVQPAQSISVSLSDDASRVLISIVDPQGNTTVLPLNFSVARRIALGLFNAAQAVEDTAVQAFAANMQAAAQAAALAGAPPASGTPS